MTIITKPFSDKKPDKLGAPPAYNDHLIGKVDVEAPVSRASHDDSVAFESRYGKASTTFCLLLTALMVMSVGIVGGTLLYRQYCKHAQPRTMYQCEIPYMSEQESMVDNSQIQREEQNLLRELFDLTDQLDNRYEIQVPSFTFGRRGRFVHDFNVNISGIIDQDYGRCYVMPLNTDVVLKPGKIQEILEDNDHKVFNINTEVVRQTMRIEDKPLTDTSFVGDYINTRCKGLSIYRLINVPESGISKRSVDGSVQKHFVQFAGKKIQELELSNIADLD